MADLASAWVAASEEVGGESLKGTNQDSDQFWSSVRTEFDMLTPSNFVKGTYKERALSAMQSCWAEKIARDVKKFNKALLRVMNAKPTGVTEDQKINLAVAIHMGRVDTVAYRHKDFDPHQWKAQVLVSFEGTQGFSSTKGADRGAHGELG